MALLEIQDLQVSFGPEPGAVHAVDGVSLTIEEGEVLCLVGESGCGKTVTALSVARLLASPPARYSGAIRLHGRDVLQMSRRELRRVRGGVVGYVFQEPAASLHPAMRIGAQVKESLRVHRQQRADTAEVVRLLRMVGIGAAESRHREYPHQLSGGMLQRVMIAMAIASGPALLIADEPTTALDVTIQAQVLDLLRKLRDVQKMSLLLITHNLGIISDIADRVAVMYAGQIVEYGSVERVLRKPAHPYTRALMASVPRMGASGNRLATIPGQVPDPASPPTGCRFHPRCPQVRMECREAIPEFLSPDADHWVRCPYWS